MDRAARNRRVMIDGHNRVMSLPDAAQALEDLAAGHIPDRARLIAGVVAVDGLDSKDHSDRDLVDARIALKLLAIPSRLESNQVSPVRAALLAAALRQVAEG